MSHQAMPSALHIMRPMQLPSLKLPRTTVLEDMHLQENSLFNLGIGVNVTQNDSLYPLHHVTYMPAKFEVATSKARGRHLQENTLFDL